MLHTTFCFVLNSPPKLVSAGEDAEALLGYAPDEFLSARVQFMDRIHAEDAGLAEALFSPNSRNTSGFVNLRIRHADGTIRCVKARYAKTSKRDDAPRLELRIEDAREVSEPGDATLIASFKSLIEHTADYVYIKNRNHVILAASQTLPSLMESNGGRTELVGTTDYDNHPEETADIYYRLEEKAFAEGKRVNEIQQVPAKDGTRRWIDNRKYPINGPGGEIIGIFGVAPDITEAIEAEKRLHESEESLREAQAVAGLSTYVLDIPDKVWRLSPELETLLGLDDDYGRGFEGIWPLIHPDDRARVAERLKNHLDGKGLEFDSEYRIVRRTDGAVRWVHTRGRLKLDAQRKPLALRGTIQDITDRKQAEAALRENKDLLQLFIEHAPVALAMFDREMRYLAASQRWAEDHAVEVEKILGRSHYEVSTEIPERWKETHRRGLAGEIQRVEEDRYERADGTIQWIRWQIIPWRAADDSIGGIVMFYEDITERKLAEERLRLDATVFTGAREGITITDPAGTILEVNDAFTRITGYTREEALGRNPRILQSNLQGKDFYENMWKSLVRDGHWSGEIWNRTKGGDIYPEMLSIHAIRDAGGQVKQYVGLFTDITEVKEHEQQLELAAHYDALTRLPNRALLADRLRQAMAQASRHNQLLGVACFDLDGFKAINDSYGHSSGDALLTALAFRMKHAMREGDTLARLGGDEFGAMILDLPDLDACQSSLTHMLSAVAEEAQIGDVALRVTASAGVTFYPQAEDVDADMLLRQAYQALHEAKLAGKNGYCVYDPSHDMIVRSWHENIEHIRRALAAHEFVLYYQPKVNMRTGEVIGAEALIRWRHPERGLLPPGLFLPVIENHPLIAELGNWAIENALKQMETWQESGFEIPVSVNVSAFELEQPDFVDRLRARLAAHPRVKPSHLELEVLETSALQDVALSSRVLTACHEAGVQISVDDFGTGYSSLVYLKRLPADVLKIDQSFVRDMVDELENLTILKGILGLAEAFRRKVIAEGVETVDHGLMLLQLGCDFAQGYGIARPMPARELPDWAAVWRADPSWVEAPVVNASNRAVLFALVEHRAWYGHFLAYLQGTRPTPPALDTESCSLSAWLESQRLSAGGMSSSIQAIETLHRQLHVMAAEIYSAHASGRKQDGLGLLRQLRYLHERCLKRMQPFTRVSARNSATHIMLRHGTATSGSDAA